MIHLIREIRRRWNLYDEIVSKYVVHKIMAAYRQYDIVIHSMISLCSFLTYYVPPLQLAQTLVIATEGIKTVGAAKW